MTSRANSSIVQLQQTKRDQRGWHLNGLENDLKEYWHIQSESMVVLTHEVNRYLSFDILSISSYSLQGKSAGTNSQLF